MSPGGQTERRYPEEIDTQSGVIAWFTRNPVAANLLMFLIIVSGLLSSTKLQKEIIPQLDINAVVITVPYPGAAPAEVERGIILKIEESLKDVNAIKRIESTAQESLATIFLEIYENRDVLAALNEIKSSVDTISTFPQEAEKPVIKRVQVNTHNIRLSVYGDLDESGLTSLVEEIREELIQLPELAVAEVWGRRDAQVTVEVSEETLRKYNLTLAQVSDAIRASSIDLPGGAIKTENGEVLLRTKGQAYNQYDFEQVVLLTRNDGTRLTLGDIATVDDGFSDVSGFAYFNGKPSMGVDVSTVNGQDTLEVAQAVRDYVAHKQQTLPDGVYIDHWADISPYLDARLSMMLKNLTMGALLVLLVLGLFLDIKLAFWVMAGLPVCFLGAMALLPIESIGVSLNMLSLLGFILVLGIVVDDAIIIGESVSSAKEQQGNTIDAIISGAKRVATPATFGVLTTIVAFTPTLLVSGTLASLPAAFGWVVVLCLAFSLIESKWILPAHLSHGSSKPGSLTARINRFSDRNNHYLRQFVDTYYRPALIRCMEYRYITSAVFLAMLIIVVGLIGGGITRVVMMPELPGEFIQGKLEMLEGSTAEQTLRAHDHIIDSLNRIRPQLQEMNHGKDVILHELSSGFGDRHVNFMIELTKLENSFITSTVVVEMWRKEVGEIPGAKVLSFSNNNDEGRPALGFKLVGAEFNQLKQAADELAEQLTTFRGVFDIRNNSSAVQDEIILSIKPEAEALGLTQAHLAMQVRQAFYGAEAQRIQRGTEEVKVMVRYPKSDRRTLASLENMFIRTPAGDEVPFRSVAEVEVAPGYTKTTRINGEKSVLITAQVDKLHTEPSAVSGQLFATLIPELQQRYPGLEVKMDGESEETAKMMTELFQGFALAIIGIYALLAIPLRSYTQPLVIMGVIPFGIIGAITGHILMDLPLSMMSFFGIIALAGVVVNDSLIMVDFINKSVAHGIPLQQAVIGAGTQRFRAILLTSVTTFFGLLPMLTETSIQAQIMIPMTISLGFGIVFATVITLLLIPCLYMILADIKGENRPLPANS